MYRLRVSLELREGNDHIMEGTSDKTQEIHPTLILEAQGKPLQVFAVSSNKVLFH